MEDVNLKKWIIAILVVHFCAFVNAAASVNVSGKVLKISNGNVEISNKNGLTKIIFKKLPSESQKAVQEAMISKKEIFLKISPDMIAQ